MKNLDFKDLNKIFKPRKHFKKISHAIKPDIYWNSVLFLTFLLVVASFSFGYYMFTKINQEFESATINTSASIETVKKDRVDQALDYFKTRQKESIDILNSPSPIADPAS